MWPVDLDTRTVTELIAAVARMLAGQERRIVIDGRRYRLRAAVVDGQHVIELRGPRSGLHSRLDARGLYITRTSRHNVADVAIQELLHTLH